MFPNSNEECGELQKMVNIYQEINNSFKDHLWQKKVCVCKKDFKKGNIELKGGFYTYLVAAVFSPPKKIKPKMVKNHVKPISYFSDPI